MTYERHFWMGGGMWIEFRVCVFAQTIVCLSPTFRRLEGSGIIISLFSFPPITTSILTVSHWLFPIQYFPSVYSHFIFSSQLPCWLFQSTISHWLFPNSYFPFYIAITISILTISHSLFLIQYFPSIYSRFIFPSQFPY